MADKSLDFTVIIAADKADARAALGLTEHQLRQRAVITPLSMSGARGFSGLTTVTITARALDHPMLDAMLLETYPCLI